MPDESPPNDSSVDNGANNCRAARVAFSVQLDGELGAGGHTRLAQHLRRCQSCRAFARELKAISGWLRAYRQEPMPDVATRPSLPVRLGNIRRQHADTAGEPRMTIMRSI
jgi:predicted anti-sigma-YlaC factor YlaD